MEKGLLWLPLLAVFFWLAWAGWNEYQKVEAYRSWAGQFDRAKYDIYAVLGQKGDRLTWGKPTRSGPINLQTFSLKEVQNIYLLVDDQRVDLGQIISVESLPSSRGGVVSLEFLMRSPAAAVRVPFTELSLAVEWANHLHQDWRRLHSEEVG